MTTTTQVRLSRRALAALSLPVLMASLDTSIANTALPTFAKAFAAPFGAVQWIVLAYLTALTPLLVVAGRLGDRFGRRRSFESGIALFTAASLACGLAPNLAILLAARVAQGLGAAAMLTLGLAFVGDVAPREHTGRVMGLLGTMSALGTAAGPALGGWLASHFGWHSLFLVNVPVGVLLSWLARRMLPSDRARQAGAGAPLDPAGALLLALTLAAYALAVTLDRSLLSPRTLTFVALTIAGATAFAWTQARSAAPLIAVALLRDRSFTSGLAASTLVSTVIMSTLVVGPFHLTRGLGLPAATAGGLLSIGPIVVALCGTPAGRAADRFGVRATATAGLVVLSLSALMLVWVPRHFGAAGYVLPLACLTAGYAFFQTANNTALLANVVHVHRGTASGLVQLSRNLGLITGASLMGSVFAHGVGDVDVTAAGADAIIRGTHATFAVSTSLALAALGLTRIATAARSRAHHPP